MAQPARTPDFEPTPRSASLDEPAATPSFSGVHGPVAAMHQAIRDRLGIEIGSAGIATAAPDPVEIFIRRLSRAMGWIVVLTLFTGTAALIA